MGTPNENAAISHPAVAGNENAQESRREGVWYQIRVRGHLGPDWSDWFEGLELKLFENGEMVLCGPIADQAALIGVLTRLNRLNLPLLSVRSLGE
jgi:hypothetical protein